LKKNKFIPQVAPDVSSIDIKSVTDYMQSGGWLTEHKVTKDFEDMIANFVGRKQATAVPNGTIAIYLGLLSAGIGKGDKVAVPNITMIATINAILWAKATPVIIDVDESLCMSLSQLIKVKNLKGVIYVPLNGRTKNGLQIMQWCKKNNIVLIEDSAHALGSKYNNKINCGGLGDISIFSFTPHKIITTGQGGMVLTNKKKYYEYLQQIKSFNRRKDKLDWHKDFGLNFKFTDLQASLGISQFKRIQQIIEKKLEIYRTYKDNIKSDFFKLGNFDNGEVPWFFEVKSKSKKNIIDLHNNLKNNHIESRFLYPAISKQGYLKNIQKTDVTYSENIFDKILWIPSSTSLIEAEQKKVIKIINDFKE